MLLKKYRSLLTGLLIVLIVGLISWYLGGIIPTLGGVTLAILLGILVGNVLNNNQSVMNGAVFAEKKLLPVAIVFLGVELQLVTLAQLGLPAIIIILISMSTALLISIYLGKLFGFSREFSILMGAGNAVCGSSAVAATSLAIDANEADIGISISIVNLLGTIGIFLIPAVISILTLSDLQGGLLIGGTLQAVGQVVAAGFSVNDDVGNIATVVKMGRILMLGPVIVLIGMWIRSHADTSKTKFKGRVQSPRFILGFFMMSLLASLNLFSPDVMAFLKSVGKFLLIIAMAGIGMRIQLQSLFKSGIRSLMFGGAIWLIQISFALLAIILII
jgi:uncharacterized integral membrane protein (TIGR00698 family)